MKKRFTRLLSLLLAIILMLNGCAGSSGTTGTETQNSTVAESSAGNSENGSENSSQSRPHDDAEHKKFLKFTNEQFLESVCQDTITLHYTLADPKSYGIESYDVTLGSLSQEAIEKNYKELQSVLSQLNSFNYGALPEEDQLTYDVLKDSLETSIKEKDFLYYGDLLTPIMGLHVNLPIALAEYTFRTEQDIQDYLTLLEQVPDYLDQVITYEKTRAGMGLVIPDSSIDEVISACNDFKNSPNDNILISSFNDNMDLFQGLDQSKKEEYKEQNTSIVTSRIFPAYDRIIQCLEEIKGTGSNDMGLCYSPRGKEYYAYLLKSLVGSGHSPEELISLVEDRINTQMMEMITIMSKEPEVTDSLDTGIQENRTPEEILQILSEKMTEDYPALPTKANYQIKYVPKSLEDSSSPAFYMIPPIDDLEENTIYINKKSTDNSTLFSTLAHEGYPGHLYQTVYASSVLTDPIRNILSYSGYQEGWGLYVEHESYMMNDILTGESEGLARIYSLNSSISLGVHAMLDLKIHYEGWTKEEASEYITSYFGPQDDESITAIYNTIVSEPAYYLKYFVGYLEIILLREKAEARLENQFDLKEFHKFFLDLGPCDFATADKYMEKWMEAQMQ